jgi:hypothetical protein
MKISHGNPINVEAFIEELRAQFPGAVASYGAEEGGMVYVQNVDEAERAAVEALLAAHDPEAQTSAQIAEAAVAALIEGAENFTNSMDVITEIANANAAVSVPALRANVALLWEFVGQLAVAVGFTPTTEERVTCTQK